MELKSVGVLSCAKVLGALYAAMGLIFGALVSLMSILGAAMGDGQGGLSSMVFGAGAIILLPIFYGIGGFIGGAISAALYNLVAQFVGGLELEFGSRDS